MKLLEYFEENTLALWLFLFHLPKSCWNMEDFSLTEMPRLPAISFPVLKHQLFTATSEFYFQKKNQC